MVEMEEMASSCNTAGYRDFASVVQTVQALRQALTSEFVTLCWCKSCRHTYSKNHTVDFEFQSLPGLATINRISIFSCATWWKQKAVVCSQAFDGEGRLLRLSLESAPSCMKLGQVY